MTLEAYAVARSEFRQKVMQHKKNRRVPIGENVNLYFEDRLTMHYQIQEILRTEKIFEPGEIQEELGAYNPLIPDGSNWKATMMLEYSDVEERRAALTQLLGIQDQVFAVVEGFEGVRAIANEDLDRETEEKTSSVHFLRFELDADRVGALKAGADLSFLIDHRQYSQTSNLTQAQRDSLVADLD